LKRSASSWSQPLPWHELGWVDGSCSWARPAVTCKGQTHFPNVWVHGRIGNSITWPQNLTEVLEGLKALYDGIEIGGKQVKFALTEIRGDWKFQKDRVSETML